MSIDRPRQAVPCKLSRRERLERASALGVTLAAGGLLACQPAPPPASPTAAPAGQPTAAAQPALGAFAAAPLPPAAPPPVSGGRKEFTMSVYSGLTEKA